MPKLEEMTEDDARRFAYIFFTDSGLPTDVINHFMTDEEREQKRKWFAEYLIETYVKKPTKIGDDNN